MLAVKPNLHPSTLCGYWVLSGGRAKNDDRWGRMAREEESQSQSKEHIYSQVRNIKLVYFAMMTISVEKHVNLIFYTVFIFLIWLICKD